MQHALRRLRRTLTVAGVAAVLPVLAACSSNFDSPVLQPYNPAVGVYDRSGDVGAYNVAVVADGSGHGTLVATLLNEAEEADRLVGVEVRPEGNRMVQAELSGQVPLRSNVPVQLHESKAVTLSGRDLRPGWFLQVTLQFANADPVTLQVPTETNDGPYADVEVG